MNSQRPVGAEMKMVRTQEAEEALQNAMQQVDAVRHVFTYELDIDKLFCAICSLQDCIRALTAFGVP